MIEFNGQKIPTSRPSDVDAALIDATGCNAAEHAAMLARGGTAAQVLQVLRPFLGKDAPPAHELTIGDAELPVVRAAVLALLAPPAPAKADK